jgi:hypothetical protein
MKIHLLLPLLILAGAMAEEAAEFPLISESAVSDTFQGRRKTILISPNEQVKLLCCFANGGVGVSDESAENLKKLSR